MAIIEDKLPINYRQAIESEESQKWTEALNEEMESIKSHHVYTLANKPTGTHLLEIKWTSTKSYDEESRLEKYKARFSITVITILAVSAQYDLYVKQLYVKTAFLIGNIDTLISST